MHSLFILFFILLQIHDFVKEAANELTKPGLNSFGLGDCKAPKVLGDIIESIAGAIFLDSGRNTAVVWKVSPSQHSLLNLFFFFVFFFLQRIGLN